MLLFTFYRRCDIINMTKDFDESKHPRDKEGKFTNGISNNISETEKKEELVKKYSSNPQKDLKQITDLNNKTKFKEDLLEKTKETIKNVENTSKGLSYEVGTIIGKDGNILQSVDGGSNEVIVDHSLLKNAIFTHNHPSGSCFSNNDIQGFLDGEVYQLRATTDKGKTYVLTRTKDYVVPSLAYNYRKAASFGGEGQDRIQELTDEYLKSGYDLNEAVYYAKSDYREEWLTKEGSNYNVKFEVEWDE